MKPIARTFMAKITCGSPNEAGSAKPRLLESSPWFCIACGPDGTEFKWFIEGGCHSTGITAHT